MRLANYTVQEKVKVWCENRREGLLKGWEGIKLQQGKAGNEGRTGQ